MGFPPQLWFDEEPGDRAPDAALAAALEDEAAREILGEVLRMRPRERRLLIGIARQIPLAQMGWPTQVLWPVRRGAQDRA